MTGKGAPRIPFSERIHRRVEKTDDGCWIWNGATTGWSGYGITTVDGRRKLAHRASYEAFVSEIPEGLEIDHLCRNRLCVNPLHLEAVTKSTNISRGGRGKLKPLCAKGLHEDVPENVRINGGKRQCRPCKNEATRAWRASRKVAPEA